MVRVRTRYQPPAVPGDPTCRCYNVSTPDCRLSTIDADYRLPTATTDCRLSWQHTRHADSKSRDEPLVRAIGTLGLAAGIVNITIGGGIFRLPANVAGSLGAAAPIAYVVCAVAMGLIVLCIADAGRRVPLTGGPYAYVGAAFGPYAGFLSGVLLWMLGHVRRRPPSRRCSPSSIGQLVPALSGARWSRDDGWSRVRLLGAGQPARRRARRAAELDRHRRQAAAAAAARRRRACSSSTPATCSGPSAPPAADVARTSLLLIFAFAGIECALVPSGEVRDTARTVPRAIALAMVGITALYIALQVVAQGILGDALATATVSPLADAAGASLGGWARSLLLAGAAISMFGYLGGMTLSMPRIVFALARDGFLPRALAAVHPRHRSPQAAILVQSVLTLALALSGTFEKLAILANVSALALYLGCALAAWRLRRRSIPAAAGHGRRWRACTARCRGSPAW